MAKYGTQAWCDAYMEALNHNEAYKDAARRWEGDFLFITEKSGAIKEPIYIYMTLRHGKCLKAERMTDPSPCRPAFIISGSYAMWKRLGLKQLDATQAIITRRLKLIVGSRGTMGMYMRYTKAINELNNCVQRVRTEWLD